MKREREKAALLFFHFRLLPRVFLVEPKFDISSSSLPLFPLISFSSYLDGDHARQPAADHGNALVLTPTPDRARRRHTQPDIANNVVQGHVPSSTQNTTRSTHKQPFCLFFFFLVLVLIFLCFFASSPHVGSYESKQAAPARGDLRIQPAATEPATAAAPSSTSPVLPKIEYLPLGGSLGKRRNEKLKKTIGWRVQMLPSHSNPSLSRSFFSFIFFFFLRAEVVLDALVHAHPFEPWAHSRCGLHEGGRVLLANHLWWLTLRHVFCAVLMWARQTSTRLFFSVVRFSGDIPSYLFPTPHPQ